MDNDLMARRIPSPSDSNRPNSAPFIPPPEPAPWQPKPAPWQRTETDAPLNLVPWDRPAGDSSVQAASLDSWPQVDLTPSAPSATEVNGEYAAEPELPRPLELPADDPASPAAEIPWDRPADAAPNKDAQAGGASWDAPPPFAMDDEPPFVDDRPAEMLAAYDDPVSDANLAPAPPAAVDAAPVVVAAQAVAEAPEAPEAESRDMGFDPYDADAPVVAEVARQALSPAWPSWNGHIGGGHEMAPSSPPSAFAAGQGPEPTSLDVPASFDSMSFEATSFDDRSVAEGSVEIEPETPAPWANDWPDHSAPVEAALAQDEAAEHEPEAPEWHQPATPAWTQSELPAWEPAHGPATPWSEPEVPAWAQPDARQWMPPADAIAPATEEVESPAPIAAEPAAEPATTEVVATVPVDAASLANGPMTVIAGPETGLPPNLVLRIQLALVDDVRPAQPNEHKPPSDVSDVSDDRDAASTHAAAAATEPVDLGWPEVATPQKQQATALASAFASAAEPSSDWPTTLESDSDFESVSAEPSASPTTFEPSEPVTESRATESVPQVDESFETPNPAERNQAVTDSETEAQPHVASVDDDDQWWVAPPQSVPNPPEGLDDQFEPATPFAAGIAQPPAQFTRPADGPASPSVAWPAASAGDVLSEWPPIWEPATPDAQAVADTPRADLPPAAGSSDWGWPASPPLGPSAPAPRVGTMEAAENDHWFLGPEPAPAAQANATAAVAVERPRTSLMTAGWTVLMAVVVVILVLVFVQLMTSLLR